MTCANFPGIAETPDTYTPCKCRDCRSEWSCPRDLAMGEWVEVADTFGLYRGQMTSHYENTAEGRFTFVLDKLEGLPGTLMKSQSSLSSLWRRVVFPSRFEREVL